jgi:hypothetical protein
MKLLEVLHVILKVLENGGTMVIQQERIVALCSRGLVADAGSFFNDLSNFFYVRQQIFNKNISINLTSRNFLDFYNQKIIKKTFAAREIHHRLHHEKPLDFILLQRRKLAQ